MTIIGWLFVAGSCTLTSVAAVVTGATLILEVPIKSSVMNLTEPRSPWACMMDAIEKSTGVTGISYSREKAKPYTLDILVDFSTTAQAKNASALVTSNASVSSLEPILNGTIAAYIVNFDQPAPLQTLNKAGDTEVAIFYLLPGSSPQNLTSFETAFAALRSAVVSASGETFATSGWNAGDVYNPAIGMSVPAYVALVGWDSAASHAAFDGTGSFQQAIAGLVPYLSGSADSDDKLIKLL